MKIKGLMFNSSQYGMMPVLSEEKDVTYLTFITSENGYNIYHNPGSPFFGYNAIKLPETEKVCDCGHCLIGGNTPKEPEGMTFLTGHYTSQGTQFMLGAWDTFDRAHTWMFGADDIKYCPWCKGLLPEAPNPNLSKQED